MQRNLIVGTAGHIDHGKSTLVKALTGIDPDRLKEEKERGITIDLGFAAFELSPEVHLGFVDVPGHERFVKNMLAGVGGIDAVLLVVAADESIKPQTREHFDICRLLGIRAGLVAVTKSDLVDSEVLELVQLEVQEYLKGSFLEKAKIIPVSAHTGNGLEELKNALLEVSRQVPVRQVGSVFRLPIDRCFTMHGYGTVVTGTLVDGCLSKDQEVEIYPVGKVRRVRNLEVHSRNVEKAVAGQRTAINLQNVEVAEIRRGMVLSVPGRFRPVRTLDASVHLLPHCPMRLKPRTPVRFHQGTFEEMAFLSPLGAQEIPAGQTGYARIQLPEPVFLLPGDRLIVRRTSPMVSIGGGVVLDITPPRRGKGDSAILSFLERAEKGDVKEILLWRIRRRRAAGMAEAEWLPFFLEKGSQLRKAIEELAKEGLVRITSGAPLQVLSREAFEELCREVLEILEKYHEANPLSPGILREQLVSTVFSCSPGSAEKAILEELARRNAIVAAQELVRLAGREVRLSDKESSLKGRIEEAFRQAGWKVPAVEDLLKNLPLPPEQGRRLLALLLKEKTLIKVAEGLYFHAEALENLKQLLACQKAKSEKIDVGQFKALTGISRKYAIPLLEFLDRERFTRRVGDYRIIL